MCIIHNFYVISNDFYILVMIFIRTCIYMHTILFSIPMGSSIMYSGKVWQICYYKVLVWKSANIDPVRLLQIIILPNFQFYSNFVHLFLISKQNEC